MMIVLLVILLALSVWTVYFALDAVRLCRSNRELAWRLQLAREDAYRDLRPPVELVEVDPRHPVRVCYYGGPEIQYHTQDIHLDRIAFQFSVSIGFLNCSGSDVAERISELWRNEIRTLLLSLKATVGEHSTRLKHREGTYTVGNLC